MNNGGTIREKNGKYVWVGYYKDENGVVHRPSKTFNTLKEAEVYRDIQANTPKHVENAKNRTNYTVEEYFEIWKQETQWSTEKFYKFTTTNNWRTLFPKHILPYIGKEPLQMIDYTKLQVHFNDTKLSKKTYHNILQAIKSMIKHAENTNENLVIINKLHKVKILVETLPKEKVYNIMSRRDYDDILNYMLERNLFYAHLISFLHETGLRIEEALALTLKDVFTAKEYIVVDKAIKRQNVSDIKLNDDDPNTRIVVSEYLKTESSHRFVALNRHALITLANQKNMLDSMKIKSKFVFPTKNGKPADARNVLRSFHSAIKAVNKNRPEEDKIPIRGLHSLRKMCCKRLKDESGLDWDQIAHLLGHSSPEVTKKYYYSVSDDDMMKIAAQMNANDKRNQREYELRLLDGADGDAGFEVSDREREYMKKQWNIDI